MEKNYENQERLTAAVFAFLLAVTALPAAVLVQIR
jgi:hypothetical protein